VKDDRAPAGIHLFQWVRDVDAYHEEIAKRGAQIASVPANQPYGIRELAIRDINGIGIVFGQDIETEQAGQREHCAFGG